MRKMSFWWTTRLFAVLLMVFVGRAPAESEMAEKYNRLSLPGQCSVQTSSVSSKPGHTIPIYIPIELACNPSTVSGGQICSFTVSLNSVPNTNQTVTLSTDSPAVFADMPTSVVIAAGTTSVTFSAQTNTVNADVTATITASNLSGSTSGQVVVTP